MKRKKLEVVSEEKDLGVIMSNNMCFSKYVALAKANGTLGMIKRAFSYIDNDSLLVLYKSFVRPYLGNCVQAWPPFLGKDKNILEKVQRRATKSVPELQHMSYEDRLSSLGLTTLED